MKITRSNYREEVVADLMDAINETAFILALGMTVDLDDNGITINEEHSLAYPFIRHDLEVLVEKAMVDLSKRANRLGLSLKAMEMLAHLTDDEICTRRCDGCDAILEVHGGGAWRFRQNVIRCAGCQAVAREHGYDEWEAKYVC